MSIIKRFDSEETIRQVEEKRLKSLKLTAPLRWYYGLFVSIFVIVVWLLSSAVIPGVL
jgi:hypothetical protein